MIIRFCGFSLSISPAELAELIALLRRPLRRGGDGRFCAERPPTEQIVDARRIGQIPAPAPSTESVHEHTGVP
jgi:hypothetical protein